MNKELASKSEAISREENNDDNPVLRLTNSSQLTSDTFPISEIRSSNVPTADLYASSTLSNAICRPTSSGVTTATGDNPSWPSPIITSLYPDSIIAGSGSCTLTIDGNNFIPGTRVLWDARDYTKKYLSPYQMTAIIPSIELAMPGQHYVWVNNPIPCGGNSNIATFPIRDNGQSFPLTTNPLILQILKAQTGQAVILVQSPSKGLLRYNLTLSKDSASPFSFFFSDLPSWVSDPQVSWQDINHLLIKGGDANNQIRNGTGEVVLVNISIVGGHTGSGFIQCTLNEVIADDGTRYGSGYTALPVTVKEIMAFPSPAEGMFSPPTDADRDGLYEDINGNGRFDLNDVVIFFHNMDYVINHEPWWLFDFDQNDNINLNDIVALFQMTIP